MNKTTLSRKIFIVFNTLILSLLAIVSIYPIIYAFLISISDANQVMAYKGFVWKPLGISFAAYKRIFKNSELITGYMNTIFVVGVGTLLNMLMTSMGAYFLSRKEAVFRKGIMIYIIITMYFSGGMVPTFLLVKGLGLYDSIFALIIPGAVSAYNLIILKNGFESVPDAIVESATIDGAGSWRILFKIVIPMSMASFAVVMLYYGVAHWNSWFNAMIYLKSPEKFPLQLILRELLIVNSSASVLDDAGGTGERVSETIQYAIIIVATIPILCVYPFIQKFFEKGVMLGGVKG